MARLRGFLTSFVILAAVVLFLGADSCVARQTWLVGGIPNSWTIPDVPTFFQDWADSVHPKVGDALLFQWGPAAVPLVPSGPGAPAPAPSPAGAQMMDARESLEDPEAFETGQAGPPPQEGPIPHTLWLLPDDNAILNCDFSPPAAEVIPPTNALGLSVSWGLGEPGYLRFGCSIPTHCQLGMRFRIRVDPA